VSEVRPDEYKNSLLLFSVARLGLAMSLRGLDLRLEFTTLSNILGDSSDAVNLREGGAGSGFSAETVSKSLPDRMLPNPGALPSTAAAGDRAGVHGELGGRAGKGLSSFLQK
jgi:hypothetical protein